MKGMLALLTGMAAGAALMYILDPERGRTRRKYLGDQATELAHDTAATIQGRAQDLANRAAGAAAKARSPVGQFTEDVPDDVLVDRVRAKIGRAITHAGAATVTAHDGVVTLAGPMLRGEVNDLLDAVRSVPGVKDIRNQLDVHETADGIPELQTG